ncbi:UDP-N-acetylmuramoyl-tripeptide--D-alanyl-D-alanine ligase [Silanimonas sp.]|uniref:UDP-N-acetylmuramoyl-tripeptide--D-alanyl-D- alanine ligase n=1 Tax=Silanimonas sp. TaxID=1929290 RepID=UPI001BC41208|nr:UDP-N-acetylmuramoyl-tripeptide--D-alanyl-D-alanine ligase [Silanimonas sp.]MBS3896150.1 UDP-N-acetylmuramoyl-tripeptide--D-alanyl-D-alanine ligase [Silanimonas sp.]
MRPVALGEIARWTGGRLIGADTTVDAIATDTRTLAPGALFIALRGERFDAHAFIAAAEAAGAAAVMVSRPVSTALPQVHVADTQEALGELAAGLQRGRPAVVLALTGSNGKTSVKSLLQGILERVGPTHASPGNLNNEIGLPLAVIGAPEAARFAIYEMGAGGPGDIAYLCSIVTPQVALVNNVAAAHIERLGSLVGIAGTKAAIYEALPDDGIAVVNADDAFAPFFLQRIGGRRVLRYGIEQDADVRARGIVTTAAGSRFELLSPAGRAPVTLSLPGRHNVQNALAAATLALAAGAGFEAIVAGLEAARPVRGRQVAHRLASGSVLIDDSYNANPGSLAAAIATLAVGDGPAWLVLGDMRELGPEAAELHAAAGRLAKQAGLAALWTVGEWAAEASRAFGEGGRHFADQASLVAALREALRDKPDLRCLVKGSRGSAMDKVVAGVLAGEGADAA